MEREFWKQRKCDREVYRREENDLYVVFCLGVIAYLKDDSVITDLLTIADVVARNNIDFNNLHGFYRIVVYEKATKRYFFWGDNAGSQRFFVDEYRQTFSDSLLVLRENRGADIEPCCSAIAALIPQKEVFTGETIIKGIYFTNPEEYYVYNHGDISSVNKKLLSLSENKGRPIKQIMDVLLKAIGNVPISAVCTGGTDSRVILSHLIYAGRKPQLIITGREDNPDVMLARKIAHKLQLPLTVYNPEDKEEGWLEKGYIFSDGICDPILSYRHVRKLEWALKNNISYEFGGVGGEFAKNYYLRYPSLKRHGKVNVNFVMKNYLSAFMDIPLWSGTALKQGYWDLQKKARKIVNEELEATKFLTMNRMGMRVLAGESLLVANNMAIGCVKIDPFMDRDAVAGICQHSQWECSLHKWHRKQIRSFCPQLSTIPTDTGYSFSMSPIWLLRDLVKRGYLMCYNGLKECTKIVRNTIRSESKEDSFKGYWDRDGLDAMKTDSFQKALDNCKRLGVVSKEASVVDIPPSAVGILYMVGRMFSEQDIGGNEEV